MNLIVTNLNDESLPLLDYNPPIRTRNKDGTHTLSVVVRETPKNKRAFDLIEHEGKLSLANNTYRIKKMERDVKGNAPQVEITALHTFFDIVHDYQYEVIPGEKVLTLHKALTHALEGTGITFIIDDDFDSISFEDFGDANCLNMFEKLRTSFNFEYVIENDTFLRIKKQIGKETSQQVRWKHNIKHIKEDIDTTNLSTYIRGVGKRDEETGEPIVQAEYTSPRAHLYEKLYHADPVDDERFVHQDSLLKYMKSKITDKPEISYTIGYAELQKTGVEFLDLGDSAFLIHEILKLDFLTRVVEIIDFPTLPNRKPIYTISSKKESMTDKQVQSNIDKQSLKDNIKWTKNKQTELDRRMEKVAESVDDVENAMQHVDREMERLENEVIPEIEQALEDVHIPKQTTPPDHNKHELWWDTSQDPPRLKRWNGTEWVALALEESEIDDLIEQMKDDVTVEYKQYTDEEVLTTKNNLLQNIAEKADLTYVNGELQAKADNSIVTAMQKDIAEKVDGTWVDGRLKSKADADSVYTINQIDTMFDNVVSVTEYTTDKDGFVTRFENNETRIYQTEQELGSKVEHVEMVNAINDIEIGGRNLLLHSDLRKASNYAHWRSVEDLILGNDPVNYEGFNKEFLRVSVPSAPIGENRRIRTGYNVSLIEDQEYTLSFIGTTSDWLDNDFNYTAILRSSGSFATGGNLSSKITKKAIGSALIGDYSKTIYKYSVTFVFEDETASNYALMIGTKQTNESGAYFIITEPMLTDGNKVIPWNPAPEDAQNQIDGHGVIINKHTTDILQNATEISRKASQTSVNTLTNDFNNLEAIQLQQAGLIEDRVTKTAYRTDQQGIVTRFDNVESVQTQQENLIRNKVEQNLFDSVTNSISNDVSALDIKANGILSTVNSIRIGGRNLLRDTDFSIDGNVEKWVAFNGADRIVRNKIDDNYFLRVISDDNLTDGTYDVRTPYHFSLKDGQTYTLSWIGAESDYAELDNIYLLKRDSTSPSIMRDLKRERVDRTDIFGYQKNVYKYSATFDVDGTSEEMAIQWKYKNTTTGSSWFMITNPQIEHGTMASDWQPSEKDFSQRMSVSESAINQLSSEVDIRVKRDEVIARINVSPETIKLQASRVDISGLVSFINNDSSSSTLINGGRLVNKSITTNELNVNQIFANSAVIAKIRSDIILTTELSASRITTGTLNALDVSIINLSASNIVTGVLDGLKARIKNIDASEINAGELNAIDIYGSTITASILKAGNNATQFDLNNGELYMRSADIVLGGGANIDFTSVGNRITYERTGDGTKRTAGFGVGRSINETMPYAFMGATGTSKLNFDPTDDNYYSGFIANTRARTVVDGIGNSVVGNVFHIRDLAVEYRKGFEFDLTGNTIVMRPMSTGSYEYTLGNSDSPFSQLYLRRRIYADSDLEIRNRSDVSRGWRFETSPSGNGDAITLRGINAGSNNYQIGSDRVPSRILNIYLRYSPDVSSDARLKEDFNDLDLGLDFVNRVNPKSYRLKLTTADINQGKTQNDIQYGIIAQQVNSVLADFGVSENSLINQGEDGYLSAQYEQFVPILIKSVQEVDKKFTDEISWLKVENKLMREEIKQLREMVA